MADRINFGKLKDVIAPPNLIEIQINSYLDYLQKDTPISERKNDGLEAVFREVFPIESYDGNMQLEYISYDLGKPRYTPEECRQLRLTYGKPFRVWLRLKKTPEFSTKPMSRPSPMRIPIFRRRRIRVIPTPTPKPTIQTRQAAWVPAKSDSPGTIDTHVRSWRAWWKPMPAACRCRRR